MFSAFVFVVSSGERLTVVAGIFFVSVFGNSSEGFITATISCSGIMFSAFVFVVSSGERITVVAGIFFVSVFGNSSEGFITAIISCSGIMFSAIVFVMAAGIISTGPATIIFVSVFCISIVGFDTATTGGIVSALSNSGFARETTTSLGSLRKSIFEEYSVFIFSGFTIFAIGVPSFLSL